MADLIRAFSGLIWPVLAIVVAWKLLPELKTALPVLRERMRSADMHFEIGPTGVKASVEDASASLAKQVADLQDKVFTFHSAHEVLHNSSIQDQEPPLPAKRRIVWADDHPEHNLFELLRFQREGLDVVPVRSTEEAMTLARSGSADVIITNVSRREGGRDHPQAGIELLDRLKSENLEDTPVLVYCSRENVARYGREALARGARIATASPLELLACLRELGMQPLHK